MKSFKEITIFENNRRLDLLIEFRNKAIEYFNNSSTGIGLVHQRRENSAAVAARQDINRILDEVDDVIYLSGVSTTFISTPAPAVGGYVKNVDLIMNIFMLGQFDMPPSMITDAIDRAIGIYEKNKRAAVLRTINPFHWIAVVLDSIVSVPFALLGRAGLNKDKMEGSLIGKLFKGFLYLVIVFSAFLTVLEKLGYLNWFKDTLLSALGIK
jgi:hypothetical protein